MKIEITNQDVCDELDHYCPRTKVLSLWFRQFLYDSESTTEKAIDNEIKIELERSLRGAIEGVTNMHPKYIIIDLDRNDT